MGIADLLMFVGMTVYVYGLAFDIRESIEKEVTFWAHVDLLGV